MNADKRVAWVVNYVSDKQVVLDRRMIVWAIDETEARAAARIYLRKGERIAWIEKEE
jgi:hypothetical protein